MYITTQSLGEAKADSDALSCGCMLCQGKSTVSHGRAVALAEDKVQAGLQGTVPSTIAITSDRTIPGAITPGETGDAYTIQLVAGQTYSFALRGVGDNGLDDPLLALFGPNGGLIDFDDDGGAGITSLITYTAAASGAYTLGAFAFAEGDIGNYALDVWVQRTVDRVADTFGAATEITVGTTFGHIETSNDIDTYKVYLEAGKFYTFELAGGADYATDPQAVPRGELDTILGIYRPDGTFIGFNDDLSFPGDISSGFSFLAEESGYYFLDALAYESQTGGYTLDVREVDLASLDPLDSIDWRSADTIPTVTVNGRPTAYVYFGNSDENFGQFADDGTPMVTIDWNAFEKGQVMLALDEYERILGIDYQITTDVNQATFRLLKTESEQYGAYFFPQDPAFGADQGVGVFNVLSGGWNFGQQQSLQRGGYSFAVILHEFGHAHGLAHPHDNGGGSDILPGVTASTGSYGVFDLNQGVYTVMSYNDGFPRGPNGPSPYTGATIDRGWSGTLGAFDIAQLQERYGVTQRNTGNDVYQLRDANARGTFYETIWDSGGTDEIRYDGARATQIDLTAATLDYTPTGGGVVSFVDDIFGGYTIAGDVVIENARGGSGADVLLGNAVANRLIGNDGDDFLMGRGGADTIEGGAGTDTVSYADAAAGVTVTVGNGGSGSASDGDRFTGIERVEGSAFADTLNGGNAADTLFGLGGNDRLSGGNAADTLDGGDGDDTLDGGNDNDVLSGGAGNDRLSGGNGNDTLNGGGGADLLEGGNGTDVLAGGGGNDRLQGGNGDDRFVFAAGGGSDTILDFRKGDLIDLSALFGVDRSDLTITGNRIFVENGADDLTIIVEGDKVTDKAFIFAPAGAVAPASSAAAFSEAPAAGNAWFGDEVGGRMAHQWSMQPEFVV